MLKTSIIPQRFRKPLAAGVGAMAGFAYYYYIGCTSGTCPITGNPWISTAYGGLIGWLVVPGRGKSSPPDSQIPGSGAPKGNEPPKR